MNHFKFPFLTRLVIAIAAALAFALPLAPAYAAALTQDQVNAIVSLLVSFNADSATVAQVKAVLSGTSGSTVGSVGSGTVTGSGTVQPSLPSCPVALTRDLYKGMSDDTGGSDVAELQKYLASTVGFSAGATGYFGPLTTAAVEKLQEQNGVPATGYFGPMTRAALHCGEDNGNGSGEGIGTTTSALSADPSSGPAPLSVSFSGTGVKGGGQYIVDYGDGANSGALTAIDVCMHLVDGSGGCPRVSAEHTYTTSGTYTATLQSYISCMWSNPRCMLATIPLGKVTVTVTGSSTTTAQ